MSPQRARERERQSEGGKEGGKEGGRERQGEAEKEKETNAVFPYERCCPELIRSVWPTDQVQPGFAFPYNRVYSLEGVSLVRDKGRQGVPTYKNIH